MSCDYHDNVMVDLFIEVFKTNRWNKWIIKSKKKNLRSHKLCTKLFLRPFHIRETSGSFKNMNVYMFCNAIQEKLCILRLTYDLAFDPCIFASLLTSCLIGLGYVLMKAHISSYLAKNHIVKENHTPLCIRPIFHNDITIIIK